MLCQICSRFHSCTNRRFGALCCNACASFFWHNILKHDIFKCFEDNDCLKKPSSKAARNCPKCRLDKCLKLGMKLPPPYPTFVISTSPLPLSPIPINNDVIDNDKNIDEDDVTIIEEHQLPPTISFEQFQSFARTLDTLLDTAVNYPKLLELYLNYEIQTLLNISLEVLKHNSLTDRIQYLTMLFSKYPIVFDELHILCVICICKLEFHWLPESQRNKIKEAQKVGYKKVEEENIKDERLSELITLSGHCLNIFNALLTIP